VSAAGGLKLSVLFGERDTVGGRFLAERIVAELERAGVAAAILTRGAEGFGIKHRRRTDRLLTLSEDLPVVAVGVGEPGRVEAAAARIGTIGFDGLVTLERLRLLDPADPSALGGASGDVKLSVYLGRGRRIGGEPAHRRLIARLHEAGAATGTVLLGVDGILGGARRRAGFFARNADVPALAVAVGPAERLAAAAAVVVELPGTPVATLERVHVCKRDGGPLGPPPAVPERDRDGRAIWQKLTLYSSEDVLVGGRPAHVEAVRRLRAAAADGATALRGIWGFAGGSGPHGDSHRSLRRRVPTLTMVVDTPGRAREWLEILAELAPGRGLITSEVVPARHARGPGGDDGPGALAEPSR
jgi:PII-like signaling protein